MTNTERNNSLLQHCHRLDQHYKYGGELKSLFDKFIPYLMILCSHTKKNYKPIPLRKLPDRLRAFVARGKEDKYDKKGLMLAQKLADRIQGNVTDKEPLSNLQLLQKIKQLERQVLSNSPSGQAEISHASKKLLIELHDALAAIFETPGSHLSIFSPDRLRILRQDLVYLEKREHLFEDIPQTQPKSNGKDNT